MVVYVYICPTKTMILSCTSLYSFKLLNNYSLQNSRFFKKKKNYMRKKNIHINIYMYFKFKLFLQYYT